MRYCFACGKRLKTNPHVVVTLDWQRVYVGSDCFKHIGAGGWQPPKGGPKLYRGKFAPNGDLISIEK